MYNIKMTDQSTNHLLMVEPAAFYANPETMETNVYQAAQDAPADVVFQKALAEFRAFRDALVEAGVIVTTTRGFAECPDMVFPNCLSTHRDSAANALYIYPMLNANRQAERDPALIAELSKRYEEVRDWTRYEADGRALESTASIVMDRVNKVGYAGLSARSDEGLIRAWCEETGYDAVIFETQSHAGKPVYHTDCVMWIGTSLAGVCSDAIMAADRARVLDAISKTHAVVEFDNDQLRAFCGNALEVIGKDGQRLLAMSDAAYGALRDDQKALILKHFTKIVHSDLTTLETYGGGSARCMLMELF
ncbi:MAG: arginine deiminase-related protein [Bdellovibrionales bacterium]